MKFPQPNLREFFVLSLMIHLIIGSLGGHLFLYKKKTKDPIKVTFVDLKEDKKEDLSFKKGNFIEITKPKKEEKPLTKSALSMYKSKAHNIKKPAKKYKDKSIKTVFPQAKSEIKPVIKKKSVQKSEVVKKRRDTLKKEREKVPVIEKKESIKEEVIKAEKTPSVLKGLFIEKDNKQQKKKSEKEYSILKGFDTEKLAKLDTRDKEDESDTETVSLDSQEFKYASYFASIKRRIEISWSYPEQAAINGMRGELLLQFVLDKSGKLVDIFLINSSGHKILDEAALDAVKTASPYKPFPARIQKKKLRIIATFTYKPFYTLY